MTEVTGTNKTPGESGPAPSDVPDGYVPQGKVNEIDKARKTAEREALDLRTRLEQFEEAQKTESQKQLDAAVKAALKEAEEKYTASARSAEIRHQMEVACAGKVPDKLVPAVKALLGDVDDPSIVRERVAEILKENPEFQQNAPSPTPSQQGIPSGRSTSSAVSNLKPVRRSELHDAVRSGVHSDPQAYAALKARIERAGIIDG